MLFRQWMHVALPCFVQHSTQHMLVVRAATLYAQRDASHCWRAKKTALLPLG
jgi:hypothetical protein